MSFSRGFVFSSLVIIAFTVPAFAADWPSISAQDRAMTSIPQQPGAPAVILLREETDDNMNNVQTVFERIKILSEAGKAYATVELPRERKFSIEELSGRTVHPNGSTTPLERKVLEKTIIGENGVAVTVKAFTLPDVETGSIIDFRYTLRHSDNRVFPPQWDVQTGLFQRKAYFKFIPLQNRGYATVRLDHGQLANKLAWSTFVGNGAEPQIRTLPAKTHPTVHDVLLWVEMTMNDVPPLVDEPFMPPASLLRWKVYFYYQSTLNPQEYWKTEGKFWNNDVEGFLAKSDGVAAAVAKLTSPNDSAEQKLMKLYSFISGLKNKSRDPNAERQKAYALEYRSPECIMQSGIVPLYTSDAAGCVETQSSPVEQKKNSRGARDVLQDAGGTHNDLNRLFVAMARAAGISSSLIWVTDRSQAAFLKDYLSTDQLEGEIAVIQLDGKDVFLDPGTKFCPYGIIDWRYSSSMGLRQNGHGAELGETPSLDYRQSIISRKADLGLDQNGVLAGVVSVVYSGVAAMRRRQAGESADPDGRKKILAEELGSLLQRGELVLLNSPEWSNGETPLVGQFRVRLQTSPTDPKQLSLALDVFHSGSQARFAASDRSSPVDFAFPWQEADEVHVALAKGMQALNLPQEDNVTTGYARFRVQQKQESAEKVSSRRDFIMATALLMPDKYKEVKDLFDTIKTDDDRATVVKIAAAVAGAN